MSNVFREQTKEQIALMQAFVDGETIQTKRIQDCDKYGWRDIENPGWDWVTCKYRVKPE